MALTLTEKLDSRKSTTGDNASVEMTYILTGTSDDVVARDLVIDNTPIYYNSLIRQSIQVEPDWGGRGAGMWVRELEGLNGNGRFMLDGGCEDG